MRLFAPCWFSQNRNSPHGDADPLRRDCDLRLRDLSDRGCTRNCTASASLALSRALTRAASGTGALTVGVYEVITVISHFEPFRLSIGTEVGAPAALGLLLELVRGALKSSTAQLSLGNVSEVATLGVVGGGPDVSLSRRGASATLVYMLDVATLT